MWQKIIVFLLVCIDDTISTSTLTHDAQIFKLLFEVSNAPVQECKTLEFQTIKQKYHQGLTKCKVKSQTLKLEDQLGTGDFAVVYHAINFQGEKHAIKFVQNQQDRFTLASIRQENSVLEKLRDNNIPNVATIKEPTEVDANAKLFVISMKKYYKDILKFVDEDVPKFGWNSISMLKFVAKIGVKHNHVILQHAQFILQQFLLLYCLFAQFLKLIV